MKRKRIIRMLLVAALVAATFSPVYAAKDGFDAPTYPVPQKWETPKGSLRLTGLSLFMPGNPSPKVTAIAKALQQRLKLITGVNLPLKSAAPGPNNITMLCLSKGAPNWGQRLGRLDMKAIPALVADQGYALDVRADGVVMASASARGLSHAAITVMDMARRAGSGVLPAVKITDWPDMPVRGFYGTHVFRASTLSLERMKETASWSPTVKQGMFVLDVDTGAFRLDGHPEFHRKTSWDRNKYVDMARLLPAEGIETVPWVQMGKSIATRFGCPYAPLDDDHPVYLWAFESVADEMLEVFLPKTFCVGMNEDWHSSFGRRKRDMKQWRVAFIRFAEFLRQRGVSAMGVSDYLLGPTGLAYKSWGKRVRAHGLASRYQPEEFYSRELAKVGLTIEGTGGAENGIIRHKRAVYPTKRKGMSDKEFEKRFKALMDEFHEYARSFPADVVFLPKQSNPPHHLAFRNVASSGRRTIVFSPYVVDAKGFSGLRGNNGRFVYAAVKYLRDEEKTTNLVGSLSGHFGGGFYSIGGVRPLSYLRSAGPVWNLAATKHHSEKTERYFVKPGKEERAHSLGWRLLIDADTQGTLAEAIQRVKSPDWTWTDAREDLVARGMSAVPALLDAMKASRGELRQRFEGCLSRIARDARNGIDRGTLDIPRVERLLSDSAADLANIAAETIGAAGKSGLKRLAGGLRKSQEAAACAWALAYAKGADCGKALCGVLSNKTLPAAARANAARAVGLLKTREAAGPLAKLLATERDPAAQREAAWALALLGARDKDASVGKLLASPDSHTRCRAAIALAVLQSDELLKAGHMLAADDPNEAWIATWALFPAQVFDFHISSGKSGDKKVARRMHKDLWLDVYGVRERVSRKKALALIAEASGKLDGSKSDSFKRLKDLTNQILKGKTDLKYLK